jgi:hypothetical protein
MINVHTKKLEENKERGTQMTNSVAIKTEKKSKKLQAKKQQDLIEMIGYLYVCPNEYNLEDMAKEMSKSVRTIHRMVDEINLLFPLINKTVFDGDKKVLLSIKECCSEKYLDNNYQRLQYAPILYLFLIMLFHRPLCYKEIMEKINLKSRAKAKKIAESILDCSYIIDEDFKENDVFVGNWKFLY